MSEELFNEEDIARLRATGDQVKEVLKEIAATCRVFYSSLIELGFTEDQALTLTVAWLRTLLIHQESEQ